MWTLTKRRSCSKWVIQKVCSPKIFNFLPPLPLFVSVHFTCTPSSTYVCFSELLPYKKTFRDAYEFSNEKSGSGKKENN